MGYSLTTSLARPAARSHASPKTHVPLPRLQERGHRYYSANLSRWISRDPLGLGPRRAKRPEFLNLMTFVGNEPLGHVDPTGLWGIRYPTEYGECTSLSKKWDLKEKFSNPNTGSPEDWWNQYMDNAGKCPIEINCMDCRCGRMTKPGQAWPPDTGGCGGTRSCRIDICSKLAHEEGSRMLSLVVHEMTHCQQFCGGFDSERRTCGSCMCSEIQACARESPDRDGEAIQKCAQESCKSGKSRARGGNAPCDPLRDGSQYPIEYYKPPFTDWFKTCQRTGRLP
jgi:RHS repeat-associated protein